MAKGDSGRIVIEIDPDVKETLYSELKKDGYTLKEWFLQEVSTYLENEDQLELTFSTKQSAK